jgi:hypothetical protein
VPLIVPPAARGLDLKTAPGGWLPEGGVGPVLFGMTVTAVEQRAACVAVVTVNAAVKTPAAT